MTRISLVTTLVLLCTSYTAAGAYSWDDIAKAAYFGEIDRLRTLAAEQKNPADSAQAEMIAFYAMLGRQPAVLQYLIADGYPGEYGGLEKLFGDERLTPQLAQIFIRDAPDFIKKRGSEALTESVRCANRPIVALLLSSGANPNHASYAALWVAVLARNLEMSKLLLQHGADPYFRGNSGRSAVDTAKQLRLIDFLEQLDVQHKEASTLAEWKKLAPPANSKFAGTWLGRGSDDVAIWSGVTLNPDGSGFLSYYPVQWTQKDDAAAEVTAFPIEGKRDDPITALMRLIAPEKIELTFRGQSIALTRASPSILKPQHSNWKYPVFVRLEEAWLTPDKNLIVKINERYASLSIDAIVAGALRSEYHSEPNELNTIRWDRFTKERPEKRIKNAVQIPISEKIVSHSPMYSRDPSRMGVDILSNGVPYILASAGQTSTPYGAEDPLGESQYPYAFALIASQLFPQKTDWVLFYFLRSNVFD